MICLLFRFSPIFWQLNEFFWFGVYSRSRNPVQTSFKNCVLLLLHYYSNIFHVFIEVRKKKSMH